MNYSNKSFIPIVDGTVKMIVHAVVTDKPRFMGMNILPRFYGFNQGLTVPERPVDQIVGTGKGIKCTVGRVVTEEQHNIQIIDLDDLKATADLLSAFICAMRTKEEFAFLSCL